jgi:hypothetical protein
VNDTELFAYYRTAAFASFAGSYYFFIVVVIIRHKPTAAARRALPLIVRAFFNDTITIAVGTGLLCHVDTSRKN